MTEEKSGEGASAPAAPNELIQPLGGPKEAEDLKAKLALLEKELSKERENLKLAQAELQKQPHGDRGTDADMLPAMDAFRRGMGLKPMSEDVAKISRQYGLAVLREWNSDE